MVSKFKSFLLAGAVALPLVGTAALAQTTQPSTVGGEAGATAQATTPSVTAPTVQAPSVTAPSAPSAPTVPHAGVSTKADTKTGHKGETKATAGEYKSGEHKGAALHRNHADKTGEKSAMNGGEAKKNQAAKVPGENGSVKANGSVAADPKKL